jgi:hypothetical protein
LIIYTDGSLIELEKEKTKSTRASIYREVDNLSIFKISISLGNTLEVYDAELYAIRAGLREAFKYITYNPIIDNIYLFIDNQSAINRLKSLKIGPG